MEEYMKYLGIFFALVIQGAVMLGDVILFGVCIAMVSLSWPDPMKLLISIISVSLFLGSWNRNGAFEAWRPTVMKRFFKNFTTAFG